MSTSSPCSRLDWRSRRQVLKTFAAAAAASWAVRPLRLSALGLEPRAVSLVHTHTQEQLVVTYASGGAYSTEALASLNRFLRDHRTGEEHPIDPALFDILFELHGPLGAPGPYRVISGYRSPRTNAMLRERSGGVAAGSLHLQGRAIDVRLDGVECTMLRDAAVRLRRGGVGYYPASDFVHLDTGRFRTW